MVNFFPDLGCCIGIPLEVFVCVHSLTGSGCVFGRGGRCAPSLFASFTLFSDAKLVACVVDDTVGLVVI